MKLYLKYFSYIGVVTLGVLFLIGCANKPSVPPTSGSTEIGDSDTTTGVLKKTPALAVPVLDDAKAILPAQALPESEHRSYEQAMVLIKEEKYAQAEKKLLAVQEEFSNIAGVQANLGIIYYKTHRFAEAEHAFVTAIKLKPRRAALFSYLGSTYREQGRFQDAKNMYENALTIDNGYANAQLNLGILHDLYFRDYATALKYYKDYLQLNPKNSPQNVKLWVSDLQQRTKQQTVIAN